MSLRINDLAPDFEAETTQGSIRFHEWIGDGWAVLFSHPKDFTPVCTTELGAMAGLEKQFAERGAKIIGLSVDPVASHSKWASDIQEVTGHAVNYPLIGDPKLKIAKLYDMLPADAGDTCEGRTPALNATARSVFVVGPDKAHQTDADLPDDDGKKLRRDSSRARFDTVDSETSGGHTRELAPGRRRDYHRCSVQRRSRQGLSWVQNRKALPADYGTAGVGSPGLQATVRA